MWPRKKSGGIFLLSFLHQNSVQVSRSKFSFDCVLASIVVDNAAMIGWASMYRFLDGRTDDFSIEPRSKWSIEDLGDDFA